MSPASSCRMTCSLTFSHIERMIVGGVMPVSKSIELNEVPALNKGPFLARRELGIINVGGPGKVTVDGKAIGAGRARRHVRADGHHMRCRSHRMPPLRPRSSISPALRRTRATRR